MKSEHRHELAENDLSKILTRWGAEFDKHANTILTVLIVVTLIAAGLIYWSRTTAATSALGWTDLSNASSPEDFQNVAELYAGTPVAEWATLRAGDGFLQQGIRLAMTDRPASNERLEQAKESYTALLNNTSAPGEIREQALLGYAVTLEASSDGDTAEAISAYEQLLSEFEGTRFRAFAEDRIAELKTGGAQDFYAWFHGLDIKPPDMPMPQDHPKIPGSDDLSNLLQELGGSGVPDSLPLEPPSTTPGDAPQDGVNPFDSPEMPKKEGDEAGDDGQPATPANETPDSADAPQPEKSGESKQDPAEAAEPAAETPSEGPPAETGTESTEDSGPGSESP